MQMSPKFAQLPTEIVCHVADHLPRFDLLALAASCRLLEMTLAHRTWSSVCLDLCSPEQKAANKKLALLKDAKHVDYQGLPKLNRMMQVDSVQYGLKTITLLVDNSTFSYAKRQDVYLPVELQNPSQLDQLLLHVIPAFCVRLDELVVYLPGTDVPAQVSAMISRLQHKVSTAFILNSDTQRSGLKKLFRHKRTGSQGKTVGTRCTTAVTSLTVESVSLQQKQLVSLLQGFTNLRVLAVCATQLQVDGFDWVPKSVAHLQLELGQPLETRYLYHPTTTTLPNLRSLRVTGKWPDELQGMVSAPNLRTVWVGRFTAKVAEFVQHHEISDLVVSSGILSPLWAGAQELVCPSVQTLVLYGVMQSTTFDAFIKFLPNLSQVLYYLGPSYPLEEVEFKKQTLKQMRTAEHLRVVYVCAPHWTYRTHEVRTTPPNSDTKRVVMLQQVEFLGKLSRSTLSGLCSAPEVDEGIETQQQNTQHK